ncbi:hypothetical protein J2S53_004246 [Actinopolyspora lacussalsi]|nr:hypothetical protein [Actinopolyspora lacussalsi]
MSEVAPCETLTRNNQKSIATEGKGKSKEVLDARSCRWSISSGTVNVSLHSEKPIEELNFSKGTKKEYSINKKNGLLAIGNTEGICTVAIPFGDSQTATVDVESLKTATSCDLAKKIAPMVEQNISDS